MPAREHVLDPDRWICCTGIVCCRMVVVKALKHARIEGIERRANPQKEGAVLELLAESRQSIRYKM